MLGIIFLLGNYYCTIHAQVGITGRMNTEIVSPLVVIETEQMGFGKFVSDISGGTLQLTASGERIATGSITLLESPVQSGKFTITGLPGKLVAVVLPQQSVKLTLENSNNTLTVDNFTSNFDNTSGVIMNASGRVEVLIGATLYVGNWASNPPGFYTGTYDAVFMYN